MGVTPRRRSAARSAAPQPCRQICNSAMKFCKPIQHGRSRFDGGCEQRTRHRDDVGAHRQRLGGVHAGADAARGDQRYVGQRLAHLLQRLRGRDAPLGQRRVADLAVADVLLDAGPRRAARPCHVDGRDRAVHQFGGGRRPDAVADLLEHHRVVDGPGDVAKPIDRAGEVGVALVLHRLLQRIGMYRKRIRADAVKGVDQLGHQLVGQLGQSDVSDQQRVGRDVANREARRREIVAQHDALRAEHHADAELLGGGGQVAVDDTGELGAARHRPDQHRRRQPHARGSRCRGRWRPGWSGSARCRAAGSAPGRWSRSGSPPLRSGTRRCAWPCGTPCRYPKPFRSSRARAPGPSLTVYPHWDNGTVSEGLWIAIAVIAVLVVAAVVVFGLVRFRRRRISLDSSTSTDTATPVDRSGGYTASSGITFTQSSAPAPAPPPTRPHPSASTPAACPPSATTPRFPVTRPNARSPTCSCPSRPPSPLRPRSA